ncbi:MAG: hypothetical protein ABIJ31_00930 [Pseudomonadota bacterium]
MQQPDPTTQTIVFRCSFCEYLNSVPSKSIKGVDKTDDYFNMIQSVPDIVGSFLYHVEKGVVKSQMPTVLEHDDLEFLGKSLVKNYKICSFVYSDITRMVLVIDGRNLVVQMVTTDLALILSCRHFPVSASVETMLTRENLNKINSEA